MNQKPGASNKPSLKALREEYLRVLPYLTIREKVKVNLLTDERIIEYEERDKQKDELIQDMMMRLDALERGKERKDRLKKIK